MDSLRIIRIWAAAAWADGKLHPAEDAALRRLIDASDDLSPEERQEAFRTLKAPPDVDLDDVRRLAPIARQGVYRAVRGIVALDGQVTDDERALLEKLRGKLDLDAATVAKIESEK
jgi:tellurite resistance protein